MLNSILTACHIFLLYKRPSNGFPLNSGLILKFSCLYKALSGREKHGQSIVLRCMKYSSNQVAFFWSVHQIIMTNLNMSKIFFALTPNPGTSYWTDWISPVKFRLAAVNVTHLKGDWDFSVAWPKLWNSLPYYVTSASSLDICTSTLKSHLYSLAFENV